MGSCMSTKSVTMPQKKPSESVTNKDKAPHQYNSKNGLDPGNKKSLENVAKGEINGMTSSNGIDLKEIKPDIDPRNSQVNRHIGDGRVDFQSQNEVNPNIDQERSVRFMDSCSEDEIEVYPLTLVVPAGTIKNFVPVLKEPQNSSLIIRREISRKTEKTTSSEGVNNVHIPSIE